MQLAANPLPTAEKDRAGGRPLGSSALGAVRTSYRRNVNRTPEIRMVPGMMHVDGRRLRYAVSDNAHACGPEGPGSPPIWAVNIHGYFAGGGMYWRESARLAQVTGWRIINPSLPGFGGSDPLPWGQINMPTLAAQVEHILEHVGGGPAVILGHSMGGAVAVQYANDHPTRTLGIIYRGGVATPAWRQRRGIVPALLSPFLPDAAPFADMLAAVVIDLPDLFMGRMLSTMRSVLPDVRRNVRTIGRTMPVGSMLTTVDLRHEVRHLRALHIPMLAEWGCFDRVSNAATAVEFSECANTTIQWLPGGHSWMLARPQGQADVLTRLASGRAFTHKVEDRWRHLSGQDKSLRAVTGS
jgi:pimeloyl-ACP methyl ester carboxylesterase